MCGFVYTERTRADFIIGLAMLSMRLKHRTELLEISRTDRVRNEAVLQRVKEESNIPISPYADLLPDVFCLMVRIFRLILILLYIYIYINSINLPPIMIINRIYEHQNLMSL
jgi:hypothetical protein